MRLALAALALVVTGCMGTIRDTTTKRTAQEQLLCSTAAERAVSHVDSSRFAGHRVWIDVDHLAAQTERGYVVAAFEQLVSEAKGRLAHSAADAELVVEVSAATVGVWDGDWDLFVPTLYAPCLPDEGLPPVIKIGYSLRQGWCRLDAFCYERATGAFVCSWRDVWGRAYVGLFDDVYPATTIGQTVKARTE